MHNTFEELLAPLTKYLEKQGTKIDKQTDSSKLFFADFTKKILYAWIRKLQNFICKPFNYNIISKLGAT